MSSESDELLSYQFQICDICLNADDVLIPDCSCGRAICTRCFQIYLQFTGPYNTTAEKIFYNDESLQLSCYYCIRKEKFCWICHLSEGDLQEPLYQCQRCFAAFHLQCVETFGYKDCPMHICNHCHQPLHHKFASSCQQMSCYVCLKSYHERCFVGMKLDFEQRINACVCSECCSRIGVSFTNNNKHYVVDYIRSRRKFIYFVSPVLFLIQYRLFIPEIDYWLQAHKAEILESYRSNSSVYERFLRQITAIVCRRYNPDAQRILYEMLSSCDYNKEVAVNGFKLGFVHKVGMIFQIYSTFYKSLRRIDRLDALFDKTYLDTQRNKFYAALKELAKDRSKRGKPRLHPTMEEAPLIVDPTAPKPIIKSYEPELPLFGGIEYLRDHINRHEVGPATAHFWKNHYLGLAYISPLYPYRALHFAISEVIESESNMTILEHILTYDTEFTDDPLGFLMVVCDAIVARGFARFYQLAPYFSEHDIGSIAAYALELDGEPAYKPYLIGLLDYSGYPSGTINNLMPYLPYEAVNTLNSPRKTSTFHMEKLDGSYDNSQYENGIFAAGTSFPRQESFVSGVYKQTEKSDTSSNLLLDSVTSNADYRITIEQERLETTRNEVKEILRRRVDAVDVGHQCPVLVVSESEDQTLEQKLYHMEQMLSIVRDQQQGIASFCVEEDQGEQYHGIVGVYTFQK